MTQVDAFQVELYLDELESRVGVVLGEHTRGSWDAHRRGVSAAPPWPTVLDDTRALERLEGWSGVAVGVLAQRIDAVRHLLALAHVEADPAVARAHRESVAAHRVVPALFHARNCAARRRGAADYVALICAGEGTTPAEVERTLAAGPGPALEDDDEPGRDPLADALGGMSAERAVVLARSCLEAAGARCDARVEVVAGVSPRTYLVDPPHDVRVVTWPPTRDVGAFRALWHELGHVAMAVARGAASSWAMTQPCSRLLDEVAAELIADGIGGDALLVERLGMSFAEAALVRRIRRRRRAWWARRQWARAWCEASLYADPDAEPEERWRAVRHRASLGPGGSWHGHLGLVLDPMAEVRYLVAERLRAQVGAVRAGDVASLARASSGQWRESLAALADPA